MHVVVSVSVLEHLTERGRLLQMRQIQRVLEPGGQAVLTVSYLYPLDDRAIAVLSRDPWLNESGNRITSKLDIKAMLEAAPGLQLVGNALCDDFPGFRITDDEIQNNESLLKMELRDCEWATFARETNTLGIKWAEIGLHLVKPATSFSAGCLFAGAGSASTGPDGE